MKNKLYERAAMVNEFNWIVLVVTGVIEISPIGKIRGITPMPLLMFFLLAYIVFLSGVLQCYCLIAVLVCYFNKNINAENLGKVMLPSLSYLAIYGVIDYKAFATGIGS